MEVEEDSQPGIIEPHEPSDSTSAEDADVEDRSLTSGSHSHKTDSILHTPVNGSHTQDDEESLPSHYIQSVNLNDSISGALNEVMQNEALTEKSISANAALIGPQPLSQFMQEENSQREPSDSTKLASEYEEFMKAVSFEATGDDTTQGDEQDSPKKKESDSPKKIQPESDSPIKIRLEPGSTKKKKLGPDSPEKIQPDAPSPEKICPYPDSPDKIRPINDSPEKIRPEPDSPKTVRLVPDSSEKIRPDPGRVAM
ncbi:uncharacterized protein LOC126095585 [Schistocerca cancellata]|uniref:uncharacterized protein LOC126095585 n=1 Tax=Schistocerca cancellata TaxID=274614 RepID=UPI0021177F48|nr:uncharacterized protein LOC126095585 [Schistocerca cancellata]